MAYASKTQQTDGVPGWEKGVTRYYEYADSIACDQADTQFNALSAMEQLSQTSLVEPATPSGYKKQIRSCSVGADTLWQIDTDDGTDGYTESGGSGGGTGNSTPTASSILIGHYTA